MASYEIDKLDFGDGDIAFAVKFPIPPFGNGYFAAPDASFESESLLAGIAKNWDELWPTMIEKLQTACRETEIELNVKPEEFMGSVQLLEDDVFMGDKADVFIRIKTKRDCVPVWDYFLRESTIVHFQPVY